MQNPPRHPHLLGQILSYKSGTIIKTTKQTSQDWETFANSTVKQIPNGR